jgi:hypothetical protein
MHITCLLQPYARYLHISAGTCREYRHPADGQLGRARVLLAVQSYATWHEDRLESAAGPLTDGPV